MFIYTCVHANRCVAHSSLSETWLPYRPWAGSEHVPCFGSLASWPPSDTDISIEYGPGQTLLSPLPLPWLHPSSNSRQWSLTLKRHWKELWPLPLPGYNTCLFASLPRASAPMQAAKHKFFLGGTLKGIFVTTPSASQYRTVNTASTRWVCNLNTHPQMTRGRLEITVKGRIYVLFCFVFLELKNKLLEFPNRLPRG